MLCEFMGMAHMDKSKFCIRSSQPQAESRFADRSLRQ